MFVLCIWLLDLTVGELKSSQIRQSGEHDIEFSANPEIVGPVDLPSASSLAGPTLLRRGWGEAVCDHLRAGRGIDGDVGDI